MLPIESKKKVNIGGGKGPTLRKGRDLPFQVSIVFRRRGWKKFLNDFLTSLYHFKTIRNEF